MASIDAINDKFKKRQRNLREIGVPQVQVNPNNGQGPQGANANSWDAKYGDKATVFDVASGNISPRVANTPIHQTMGAQAGSSANPVNTNDTNNTSQTFSLADAVRMDNLPEGPSAISGTKATTPSAISQPNGAERGETDSAASKQSQGKQRFGAKDLFERTEGGLGTTQTVDNSVKSPVSYINSQTVNEDNVTNNNANLTNTSGNVERSGNSENPEDTSNGRTEEEQHSNPSARQQDQQEIRRDEKVNEEKARRRAEEEAARLRTDNDAAA